MLLIKMTIVYNAFCRKITFYQFFPYFVFLNWLHALSGSELLCCQSSSLSRFVINKLHVKYDAYGLRMVFGLNMWGGGGEMLALPYNIAFNYHLMICSFISAGCSASKFKNISTHTPPLY